MHCKNMPQISLTIQTRKHTRRAPQRVFRVKCNCRVLHIIYTELLMLNGFEAHGNPLLALCSVIFSFRLTAVLNITVLMEPFSPRGSEQNTVKGLRLVFIPAAFVLHCTFPNNNNNNKLEIKNPHPYFRQSLYAVTEQIASMRKVHYRRNVIKTLINKHMNLA